MRTLAIIAEYNPFHLGHKLHLNKSIELTKSTHTVAIMSSSFVQRGEPAILDKWTRAKIAVENGIDLVIELPIVFSLQTAELFSYGAIKILDSTNSVDFLSFGSESNNIELLSELADFLISEPNEYIYLIKSYMKEGLTFPQSREKSISELLGTSYSNILKTSNNILGLEYIKSLKKLSSNIKPITIKREGSNYNDEIASNKFASATSIRNLILGSDINKSINFIPNNTYTNLVQSADNFNYSDKYIDLLNYNLLNLDSSYKNKYMDLNDDILNRFIKCKNFYNSFSELTDILKTKNYTMSRIKRILFHILLDMKKDDIFKFINSSENYVRVLASNNKGFEVLNKIKSTSEVDIITNFNKSYPLKNDLLNEMLDYEIKATNMFNLVLNDRVVHSDFSKNIYIKRS